MMRWESYSSKLDVEGITLFCLEEIRFGRVWNIKKKYKKESQIEKMITGE